MVIVLIPYTVPTHLHGFFEGVFPDDGIKFYVNDRYHRVLQEWINTDLDKKELESFVSILDPEKSALFAINGNIEDPRAEIDVLLACGYKYFILLVPEIYVPLLKEAYDVEVQKFNTPQTPLKMVCLENFQDRESLHTFMIQTTSRGTSIKEDYPEEKESF